MIGAHRLWRLRVSCNGGLLATPRSLASTSEVLRASKSPNQGFYLWLSVYTPELSHISTSLSIPISTSVSIYLRVYSLVKDFWKLCVPALEIPSSLRGPGIAPSAQRTHLRWRGDNTPTSMQARGGAPRSVMLGRASLSKYTNTRYLSKTKTTIRNTETLHTPFLGALNHETQDWCGVGVAYNMTDYRSILGVSKN